MFGPVNRSPPSLFFSGAEQELASGSTPELSRDSRIIC